MVNWAAVTGFGAALLGAVATLVVACSGCDGTPAPTTDAHDSGVALPPDAAPPANGDGPQTLCGVASEAYDVGYQAKLDALVGCTRFLGSLRFGDSQFTNLDQLESLRFVDGSVNLFRNESLLDIDGLRNLESVGGELRVAFHDQLTSLSGLASLRSVGALFFVGSNSKLTTLDGLQQLRSVGDLWIVGNSSLQSLQGLSALESVAGDVSILHNSMLPQAAAEAFAAVLNPTGTITVSNNGP